MKKTLQRGLFLLVGLFFCPIGFNSVQAQEIKKVKAWVVGYDIAFDMPRKDSETMTEEEQQMVAMMELGKAMSGAKEGEPLLKAYVTANKMRIEQKGIVSSVQISNLEDSISYNLYAETETAYRTALATPKVSTEMKGDSMIVVSSADGKLRFSDETMEIHGFSCKKAILEMNVGDVKQDMTIWYAEKLPKLFWGEYDYLEKIPGMALKISTNTNGMDVGIKAASVKEELVDDTLFTIPAHYTIEDSFDLSGDTAAVDSTVEAEEDYELAEGYHWTDDGELWGIEDDAGNVIVEPRYHDRYGYRAGLAPVSRDDKFGVVDKTGKEIIPLEYEGIFVADADRLWAMRDGLYALIDTTNKVIVQPSYQTGSLFVDGVAYVQKGEKIGFIDKNGKVVVPFIYDEAEIFIDGKAWVKKGEEEFYIDSKGQRVQF
ncbi:MULTISPECIES: WG repeat-containing protein [Olivibacter]|uniref:WG repeat-containing protein n=1 Tax=Olivibacter oleidegradans TaxID=760123 RepID=A0ABV6HEI7_9SPHI|nr:MULTISPECIES: WG repeat-containing protein [unclassified Olivibacter]MDM8177343.1 WG repeat-containing protein [Olivibacter sp. 47]QEK99791.1 WG repeat-containing protein [Olivibacter sp. LS-1]